LTSLASFAPLDLGKVRARGHGGRIGYNRPMSEDPRYLRNQSRAVHRLHRRNKRSLRRITILWLAAFAVLTAAACLDVAAKLGWGHEAKDVWGGLLMIVFGGLFWVFANLVNDLILAISRRFYGPEPTGPTES
jgi:hypothetical protein